MKTIKKELQIDKLISKQKEQINNITKDSQFLLESCNKNNTYNDLKEALGWNDTDNKIKEELNNNLELSTIISENNNSNILSEETILEYCIKNNYVLCNIKEYKGKISEEMLKAISDYTLKNDMRLQSDANVQQLYILCQFTDLQGNNKNVKKSKRYKKGILPKIIILHKLDKGNKYIKNHYKIVSEEGELKKINNFMKSLYKTHTKTTNFRRNWFAFSLLVLLTIILSISNNNFINPLYLDIILYFSFLVLFIKTTVPNNMSCINDISFNIKKDEEYEDWQINKNFNMRDYLSYYIIHNNIYSKSDFFQGTVLPIIKLKNQIYYYSLILILLLFSFFSLHLNRIYLLTKYKRVEIVENIQLIPNKKYSGLKDSLITKTIYTKTGFLTYKSKKVQQFKNKIKIIK